MKQGASKEGFGVKSIFKLMLLLMLVLGLIAAGLLTARKQTSPLLQVKDKSAAGAKFERSIPDMQVQADAGLFKLSNLQLLKVGDSTKLKGEISNSTGQRWYRATFEVKAFDGQGNQLKGAEDITIFQVNNFEAAASASIDDGYGVWLEQIPFESISKVELLFIDGQLPATYKLAMRKPVAKDDLIFEDDAVRIAFDINADALMLTLSNKLKTQAVIDWDRASFIDPSGRSLPVDHREAWSSHGVGAELFKIMLPNTAIIDPLAPLLPEGPEAASYKGKSLGLVVPININGARKSYSFEFQIVDVEIKRFHLPYARYQFLYEETPTWQHDLEIDE
jgi:hypothetical protein